MERNVFVYPVVLTPLNSGGFAVSIPDWHNYTEGKDMADAIFMARDAIGMLGMTYEDENKELPKPNSNPIKLEKGEMVTYVDIDFIQYRHKHDSRKVRKNCTIPYFLAIEAEKRGINFSRVLSEALEVELGY